MSDRMTGYLAQSYEMALKDLEAARRENAELASALSAAQQECERYRAALEAVAEGRGRFSTDQLTFANNVIAEAIATAKDALASRPPSTDGGEVQMTKVRVNPPIVRARMPQDQRSAPETGTLENYESYITYENSGEDAPTVKGMPGRSVGAAPFLSKLANRCATCGHAEYWHAGKKNRGHCNVGGPDDHPGTSPCGCSRFKPRISSRPPSTDGPRQ